MADKYDYHLANGKTLTLEGDTPPTDEEVEKIAKEQGVQLQPADVKVPVTKGKTEPTIDTSNLDPEQQKIYDDAVQKSTLSKVWHAISDPLTTIPSDVARSISSHMTDTPAANDSPRLSDIIDIPRNLVKEPLATIAGFGAGALEGAGDFISGMTSPINLATAALTGGENLGFISGKIPRLANIVSSGLTAAHGGEEVINPNSSLSNRARGLIEIAGGITGMKTPSKINRIAKSTGEIPPDLNATGQLNVKKMNLRLQPDGSMIDKATGEVVYDPRSGKPLPASNDIPDLPSDLKGAKPRFNIRNTSYQPNFESDLDKALYVIAQKTPSKRDADYLKYVMDATGLDENAARQAGVNVRSQIKNLVKGQEGGVVDIPTIHQLEDKPFTPEPNVAPVFNPKGLKGMTGSAQKGRQNLIKSENGSVGNIESDVKPEHLGDVVDKKQRSFIKEAVMLPKGIMASYDLSAPGRQGLPLILNKEWWTSWNSMVKAGRSEEAFKEIQNSIANKPLFKDYGNGSLASKVGLHLTDLTDLSKREESLMSSWAEKLPGVRASNRAYTAYLNKLRADTFERLMNDSKVLGTNGEYDLTAAKKIANFVNVATGRGSLGAAEKYATELNTVFFSPRLIASRLQILDPKHYWAAPPALRQQAIKSLFAIAGTGRLVGELVKASGAGTVENDPASSDFGKIKVGNTRIDPYGGFQQYVVFANKILQSREKSTTNEVSRPFSNKPFQPNRGDVTKRFIYSKTNPALTMAWDIYSGENTSNGQKVDIPEAVLQRFVPLFLQDLKTVATENPNLIPGYSDLGMRNTDPKRAMLAIPGAFGAGIQNYGGKK